MRRRSKPRDAPKIDRCGITRKVRYATEGKATVGLAERRKKRERQGAPEQERRAYRCWQCQGWHLTKELKRIP